jgi:hypothetical protein
MFTKNLNAPVMGLDYFAPVDFMMPDMHTRGSLRNPNRFQRRINP